MSDSGTWLIETLKIEQRMFSRNSNGQFWPSWYIMSPNRTFEWKVMAIWITLELPLFNLERLDILCSRIEHHSEKLWPFKFLEIFPCSISSVSRASLIQFRVFRYILCPNRTSKWKVMTIWISREVPLFNFERLDILCSWIGHPNEKILPFEFLESLRYSISCVSIYYVPE